MLPEMEFYSLNVVTLILYYIKDPFHKQLSVVEVILESIDNCANGITALMICLSEIEILKQYLKLSNVGTTHIAACTVVILLGSQAETPTKYI